MTKDWTGINGDFAIGGGTDAAHIKHAAAHSVVLAGVETRTASNKPINVAAILGSQWRVCQRLSNGPIAMTFVAVRKSSGMKVIKFDTVTALPTRKGVKLQRRYLTRVVLDMPNPKVRNHVIGVCHYPPKRFRSRRWVMEKYVRLNLIRWSRKRKWQVTLFCDNNEDPHRMAKAWDVRTDGHNMMAWLWTKSFGFTHVRYDAVPKQKKWTDHPDAVAVRTY